MRALFGLVLIAAGGWLIYAAITGSPVIPSFPNSSTGSGGGSSTSTGGGSGQPIKGPGYTGTAGPPGG